MLLSISPPLAKPYASSSSSLPLGSRAQGVGMTHLLPSTSPLRLLCPPLLSPGARGGGPIRCSASQVHSDGWMDVCRRLSMLKDNPTEAAAVVLDQWEARKKRKLTKREVFEVGGFLQKSGLYKLALDVSEWMVAQEKRFPFHSIDAAILIGLIAKVRGISSAEEYFMSLSEAFRDKRTYTGLLIAYAFETAVEKAEAVLETMRKKGYLTDVLAYNVMMIMYVDLKQHKKVISLVKEMRKKKIRLDAFSYNAWILACAAIGRVEELENISLIVDKDPNLNANCRILCTFATSYVNLGKIEIAEMYVKQAECRLTGSDSATFNHLLGLYSLLGKKEEVYKTWQSYKFSFPKMPNTGFYSVLAALIKLNDIEGAESIYEEWLSTKPSNYSNICNIFLFYYAKHGQVAKAKRCLKDMRKLGGTLDATTYEILARQCIAEKQTSRALFLLKVAVIVSKEKDSKMWMPRLETMVNFGALCKEEDDRASLVYLYKVLWHYVKERIRGKLAYLSP